MLEVISRFEAAVALARIESEPVEADAVRAALHSFAGDYEDLRAKLDGLAERTADALKEAYADLARDTRFVTVMLFGRTRAGKSTTMEALTGGDGASIGVGRQHTTKDIRAYYFPPSADGGVPDRPSLRIVDTPGIEGFDGDELARVADTFVERADHILFLLTDDKATANELKRFGEIRTQGKGVTVLLNVKANDLELLLDYPQYVFKADELDGHIRRISGYLQANHQIAAPEVIPFHADAAWKSRSGKDLPAGLSDREGLARASRIADVEARILRFITQEAIPARMRQPRDLVLSHLGALREELLPYAQGFRDRMRSFEELGRRLERGTEKARRRIAKRFPLLRARFQKASDAVPGMVDELVAARGDGRQLDQRWAALLSDHGVSTCVEWFVEAGQKDFIAEVGEEMRVAATDFQVSRADGLDDLLSGYHQKDEDERRNKYARAAVRTGAGVGGAALATWGVANLWNPTGWVALIGAAVVVGAGLVAESVARTATDAWERSSKKDLYTHRSEITRKLQDRLWADYRSARQRCDTWLDETKEHWLNTAQLTVRPARRSAEMLHRASVEVIRGLDAVAEKVESGLVAEILHDVVPAVADGRVVVKRVVREAGAATKVLVVSEDGTTDPVAVCIGAGGSRIRQVSAFLDTDGQERLTFVDAAAPLAQQVVQALGLHRVPSDAVEIADGMARVHLPSTVIGQAIGHHGVNVRLASQLLDLDIRIGDRR
ncbi:GTPase [Azospirillum halopraeferens]|uniref:GTPase n=1 Tax=Azospirillum halopraeferens TaxID=34010 RepID=UPI00048DD1F2|nr:GTPase [Azospirillum halopraeferens]